MNGLALEFATAESTLPRAKAVAAPAVRARAGALHVRALDEGDLDQVADLFLQRFRAARRSERARAEVARRMKALYLDTPLRERALQALVAEDSSGGIGAFCGAMRMPFRFDGQPATALITGTLMASTADGHALAAVQIVRETRKLDCDLVVTDSANRASLALCQAMNYQVVSPDSLEWAVVFDPASLALHKLRQRFGFAPLAALTPLTRAVDLAAGTALRLASGAPKRANLRDEEVDAETFAEIAPRFVERFRLAPDLSHEDFLWLIAMARRRRSAGPLRLRVLYDGAGVPIAAYAAFAAKGGVCRVFHSVAAPHAWGRLFDKMRENARAWGCIGAHGPMKAPMLAHAYAVRGVFMYYAGGMLLYSKRPEIRRAVECGEAMLGGFAGDRWTELASDTFD